MAADRKSVKKRNQAVRQEDMRARISQSNLLTNVLDITTDLRLNNGEMEATVIQSKRAAADISMKLLNKVLPDLKQVEQAIELNLVVPKEINFNIVGKQDEQGKG